MTDERDTPQDLEDAFDDETRKIWDGLAPSHRREYLDWLDDARREETRVGRIAKTVERLRAAPEPPS